MGMICIYIYIYGKTRYGNWGIRKTSTSTTVKQQQKLIQLYICLSIKFSGLNISHRAAQNHEYIWKFPVMPHNNIEA